ncbi:MAG: hypothetical protein N3E37_00335 [Candidatus Micrarchaeota archaeon]|nr:hypothetical protein [Candidatus Micrarchaeota archaeon]
MDFNLLVLGISITTFVIVVVILYYVRLIGDKLGIRLELTSSKHTVKHKQNNESGQEPNKESKSMKHDNKKSHTHDEQQKKSKNPRTIFELD